MSCFGGKSPIIYDILRPAPYLPLRLQLLLHVNVRCGIVSFPGARHKFSQQKKITENSACEGIRSFNVPFGMAMPTSMQLFI